MKVRYMLIMYLCTILDQVLTGLLCCISHHLVLEHWGQPHVLSFCMNKLVSGHTRNEELNVTRSALRWCEYISQVQKYDLP